MTDRIVIIRERGQEAPRERNISDDIHHSDVRICKCLGLPFYKREQRRV